MVTMWEKLPLLKCVDLLQGLTYSPANVKSYGLLVLRSSNIQNSTLTFDDCVFVDCPVDESKYVQPNDILICVRNGSSALIGKSCVINKVYNATFGAFMSVLRGDDTGYFAHMFASDIVQTQIRNRSSATINQITKRDFEDIVVPVPKDPDEKRAIANALSNVNAYIAALEKLITKKRAVKQGAMQELLTGKRRLPGFSGEWKKCYLGSCFDEIVGGGTPSRTIAEYWGNELPWVTVKDFATFNSIGTQEYITRKGLENSATHLIPSGVPITSTRMGLGQIIVYDVDVTINQDLKALFIADHIDKWFIVYWFKFSQRFFEALGTGSTVKGISLSQLKEQEILLPPSKDEQTAIAEILSDMDAEINALTAKLNKAKHIKQGMMSELLTGRIRLIEHAEIAETIAAPKILELPKKKAEKKIASQKGHNEYFEDAVILGVLAAKIGSDNHPFTAFDAQKFPYLLHRHIEGIAKGYKEFAAGPYNPELKYKGARPIALKRKYIKNTKAPYVGIVADSNVQEAAKYFNQWHGTEPLQWVEQFQYIKGRRDELELLTTVDMAVVKLQTTEKPITVHTIKTYIQNSQEWKEKLKREIFSDANIARAIKWSNELFGQEV